MRKKELCRELADNIKARQELEIILARLSEKTGKLSEELARMAA